MLRLERGKGREALPIATLALKGMRDSLLPTVYTGARTPAAAIRPTTRWWNGRIALKYMGPVQAW